MESPRDPLPADVSAEPEPADPPPAEATRPEPAVPRPRDPGEPAEPLRLGEPAESLPPGDADLIAASRAGDAAAYDTLYRRHVAASHSLARQLVRNRAEADDVVAETFAKILDLLHRGGGPDDAFRPYLLTAVRRAAYDRHRAERRQLVTDEREAFDRGVPSADRAVADLERTMIARAFASLPERWQAVLWHTEIEEARPADVAPLLGLTANGVAALAYRAREGLRQAYLQMHLSGAVRDECRPVAAKLGAYVRGGLANPAAAVAGAPPARRGTLPRHPGPGAHPPGPQVPAPGPQAPAPAARGPARAARGPPQSGPAGPRPARGAPNERARTRPPVTRPASRPAPPP